MGRNSTNRKPIWTPLEAPEGYEFEMDISRPAGDLRYRILPTGLWQSGPLPLSPAPQSRDLSQGLARKQRS